MSNINNPHDKFFRETFSRLEVAQSFIQEIFPVELSSKINLNSLELTNSSFTDENLIEHLADLVYQASYKNDNGQDEDVLITLLFEHKSYTENYPHFQLLQYMLNCWKEEVKQDKQPSVVIPIIIHHGKSDWKKHSIKSYFGTSDIDLLPFIPAFDYVLFSLNTWEDHQIANFKNTFLSMATMLLKHSRDEKERFLALESFWIAQLKSLDDAHEENFIQSIFLYLENSIDLTTNDLMIIFTKVSTTVTNIAMTAAERLRIEERQITTEKTTFEYVKGLWKKGLDANFIADAFALPLQKVEEIIARIQHSPS